MKPTIFLVHRISFFPGKYCDYVTLIHNKCQEKYIVLTMAQKKSTRCIRKKSYRDFSMYFKMVTLQFYLKKSYWLEMQKYSDVHFFAKCHILRLK